MPQKWNDSATTFHLAVNMAGAVSAGAYTAGVLDFLMEALEQWYAAKAGINHPPVPMHDVSIDAFSGASAGGMCAAIASVMVQGSFQHIRNPADKTVQATTNRFYESWVNKIDIEPLLGASDLSKNLPVISLLDSSIIDEIADYALTPGPATPRPYISKSLTLFLTLTNVRGIPYSLNGSAEGSAEENIAYYADRLQFETVAAAVRNGRRCVAVVEGCRQGYGSVSILSCSPGDQAACRRLHQFPLGDFLRPSHGSDQAALAFGDRRYHRDAQRGRRRHGQ
jgi:hypothetical protein